MSCISRIPTSSALLNQRMQLPRRESQRKPGIVPQLEGRRSLMRGPLGRC